MSRWPRWTKLSIGLSALLCCSGGPPPVGGLLSSPAGMALANNLLFLANQDGNELHVFDTQLRQFRPSPNLMFPLSVPTVRRPGPVCGNSTEIFTASSVDPTLGVIDAYDALADPTDSDPDPANPARGLRELGQIALPGVAGDMVCTHAPAAVLAHERAVAGSPSAYAALVDAGPLLIDIDGGILPDGGFDERHVLANLPMAALLTFNDPELTCAGAGCAGTRIWQAGNDYTGCDGGGQSMFCPSLQPLFTLPPQPARCMPVGPPFAERVDVSGSNAGDVNRGIPNVDPSTLNRLVASDRNSNCVASVNLDDFSVDWLDANGPSYGVYAMPFLPNSCLPGGDIFAAVYSGEDCERQGPPPVGGYTNCGQVSFLSISGGGLIPEPLPYPFVPRRAMPPVRIFDVVEKVAFVGPGIDILKATEFTNQVPVQMLAMVGTASGDIYYVDLGYGRPDAGTGADDAGHFACPPAYLAPRLLDQNDYITNPTPPGITNVVATYIDGGPDLGAVTQVTVPVALTADGGALATDDRQDAGFSTPLGSDGLPIPTLSCYAIPVGSQICVTGGLMQKGVAQTELPFYVTYKGQLEGFAFVPGTLSGASLQIPSAGDLTQVNGGLVNSEGPAGNLEVQLSDDSGSCGSYLISSVSAASLTLDSQPTCAPGSVSVNIVAGGKKPYTAEGTSSGFINQLFPMDGTLHLVTTQRWHYPADLIGMLRGAEQLADFVLGPIPAGPAPGSLVTFPRSDGADYQALDSAFGMALWGPLGTAADLDAGVDAGVIFAFDGGVIPVPGAAWSFEVSNGISPLVVTPSGLDPQSLDDSLIDGMAAFTDADAGGAPHVYANYRGGNAMVELVPIDAYSGDLLVFH